MVEHLKNIIRGAASAFNLIPGNHNSNQKNDSQYMREAWEEVGKDLSFAIRKEQKDLIKK